MSNESVKLPKIKWTISPAPTGKFSSFHKRSWPYAEFVNGGNPAVMIRCEDSYRLSDAKSGDHAPLKVYIADHSIRETNKEAAAFEWKRVKGEFKTLVDAKKAAIEVYERYPAFWPKHLRPEQK
jgi:hypothetical protein